jgi:sarcosine oxidase/L-pipecolate oxidase
MNWRSDRPLQEDLILIIGGGTWGTSIAYQLAKRGYRCIKVLDANEFPSAISAGNDINKIIEERMFDDFEVHLTTN